MSRGSRMVVLAVAAVAFLGLSIGGLVLGAAGLGAGLWLRAAPAPAYGSAPDEEQPGSSPRPDGGEPGDAPVDPDQTPSGAFDELGRPAPIRPTAPPPPVDKSTGRLR